MNAKDLFRFACPHCGRKLGVKPGQAGRAVSCPKCQQKLTIPAPASAPSQAGEAPSQAGEPAASDDLFGDEVAVVCRVCRTRMYAPTSKVGQQVRCPDCYAYTLVKPPQPKRARGATSAPPPSGDRAAPSGDRGGPSTDAPGEEDEFRLQAWDQPWKASDEKLIPIVCELCHTRMYAHLHEVGEFMVCPDCGRLNRVPNPKVGDLHRQQPELPELDLRVAESEPNPQPVLKQQADEFMERAEEDYRTKQRAIPVVPDRPLLQGIYSFLFHRQIAVLWLSVATGFVLIVYVLQIIVTMKDPQAVIPGILILSVGGLCLLGFLATQMISILYNSSEGYDEIVHAPENSFIDWLLDAWVLFAAFAYSNIPSYLLFNLGAPRQIAWPVSVAATFLLFPIFLLSMLEAGSRLIPYSDEVWRSLTRHTGNWVLFYLQTLVYCAAVAGLGYGLWVVQSLVINLVLVTLAGPVISGTLILYFRLLGRIVLASGELESIGAAAEGDDGQPGEDDSLPGSDPGRSDRRNLVV